MCGGRLPASWKNSDVDNARLVLYKRRKETNREEDRF